MNELAALLGQLNIPPEQMARIAREARANPLAAMGLLNEYMTPEMLQRFLAVALRDPAALAQIAEQAGVSADELARIREQLAGSQNE